MNAEFTKKCPNCQDIIEYLTKNKLQISIKLNCTCKQCKHRKHSIDMTGEKNSFYGRKHNPKSLEMMQDNKDKSFFNTLEYIEKQRVNSSGKNNPMFKRSVYSIWLQKYGKDEADRRNKEWKIKQSIKSKGRIGNIPHHHCGKGWKGKYKNFYFRSLGELFYMIYLDENNIKWESAENNTFKIFYFDENGDKRTYRPDFYLPEQNELIEIKPIALQNTKNNICKFEAAREFSKLNKLSFNVIDCKPNVSKIFFYLNKGYILFSKGFKEKFNDFYKKFLTQAPIES